MGPSGELERLLPRWAVERTSQAGAKQDQAWRLHRVQPLVVRKARQSSDLQFCQPLRRLLEPEGPKAQLAVNGDSLPVKDSNRGNDVPSTPPTMEKFEELIVPDSPEEARACEERTDRSGKLRRASLRKNSVKVRSIADWESLNSPQSNHLRPSKHDDKFTVNKASVHQNFDHPEQNHVQIATLAAKKTTFPISEEPVGAGFNRDLETATGMNRQSGGIRYQRNLPRDVHTAKSLKTEDAASVTNFVTGSGKPVSVSAMGLENARALFGDGDLHETKNSAELAGAGHERTLPQHVQAPMFANTDGAVPLTCFMTGSGKPVSVSSMGWAKANALFGDDIQGKKDGAKPAGIEHQRNQPRDFQTPAVKSNSGTVPITSLVGSGKTVSVSTKALDKARAHFRDPVMEDRNAPAVTLTTFSTASGKPISVSSAAMKRARVLLQDDDEENQTPPAFPSAASLGNQLRGGITDGKRVGNLNFGTTGLHTTNGRCPSAEPAHNSFIATEKGSFPNGYDEQENRVSFGRATYLGSSIQPQVTNNSELSADKTGQLRSVLPTGAWRPISPSIESVEGQKFQGRQAGEVPQGPSIRTRTGRVIALSSEGIEKAKVLLANGERMANLNDPSASSHRRCNTENTEDPQSKPIFQTGSGRTITISREAMERVNGIFSDSDKKVSLCESTLNTRDPSPTPTFRTASGRDVTISSEAMTRAKALLAPKQLHLAEHSPSHYNKGLNAADFRENMKLDSNFGQPLSTAEQSPQFNLHNLDDVDSSPPRLPSITKESNLLRGARAFKPPRFIRKQPDFSFMSRKNPVAEGSSTSGANSFGNQQRALNSASALSECNQLEPSIPGYLQKGDGRSGCMKLREYMREPPACDSEVLSPSAEVMLMTADAAENHRIQYVTEDGRRESLGRLEVRKWILGLGADPQYASGEWVANHYKWIVWKLAFYERRYSRQAAQKLLTVDTVLYELKSRYDKELSGHRSAIRRITEGDSLASRKMVLRVSAVRHYGDNGDLDQHTGRTPIDNVASYDAARRADEKQQNTSQTAKIELTDGWYKLNAVLDAPLTRQLQRGKLKIHQKIQICGASLGGCPDGRPPLEAFRDSFLTLHMNGTYRARRNQRLGFCRDPWIPLAFNCIKPDGGLVPQTYVGVTRVYPILYKETSAQGISVMRSARGEDLAANQFEHRRANVMEEAILKLETSHNSAIFHREKDKEDRLFAAVESAAEPDILMADMTTSQLKAFAVYQAKRDTSMQAAAENAVKEALQEAGLDSRNVKRLLKVHVTGLNSRGDGNAWDGLQMKEGMITIWDVADEQYIQEGFVYCVSGLKPATWVSSRNQDQLQLNSFSSAKWRHVPEAVYEKHFWFPNSPRTSTRLSELDENCVNREFDIAAMVFQVGEPFFMGTCTNQWLFMTDGSTARNSPNDTWDETQVLAVRVSMPSQAFVPVENSLVGSVIGYCNLRQQLKDRNHRLWVAEGAELAIFSSNLTYPSFRHLQPAADSVSKWARSNPWMGEHLRELLHMSISVGAPLPTSK